MNHNQSSPTGHPQNHGGTPPAEQPATKAARPWFTKKRFVIPGGLLALFIVIGVAGGGGDQEPVTAQSAQSSVTPTATENADVALADATQESKVDAERAAEESAAAEAAEESAAAEAAEEAEAAAQAEADARAAEEAEAEAEAKAAEEAEAEAEAKAAEEAEAEAEAKAAEEAEAEAKAAEEAAAEEAARGTLSQQNALRSAENYLDFTAFSRTGLIDQLEFEEYSTADATWAVDRVEVDWDEQAAESAENYLSFTSFSRAGLIDQLIFEGFTPAQAEYGVSFSGALRSAVGLENAAPGFRLMLPIYGMDHGIGWRLESVFRSTSVFLWCR